MTIYSYVRILTHNFFLNKNNDMSLFSARASYIETVLFFLPGMDNKEVTSFEQFSWIVIDPSINVLLKYSPYKYDMVL